MPKKPARNLRAQQPLLRGPANPNGLRIRSFEDGEETVCTWEPQKMHEAFDNMLNGGIVGALLDCHCNWTAANFLMKQRKASIPPCTVTASYEVKSAGQRPQMVRLRSAHGWSVQTRNPATWPQHWWPTKKQPRYFPVPSSPSKKVTLHSIGGNVKDSDIIALIRET